jgi:hypothetical protein
LLRRPQAFAPALEAPRARAEPLAYKNATRTPPLKIVCCAGSGALLTDEDIPAPAVVVTGQADATTDGRLGKTGVAEGRPARVPRRHLALQS